MGSGAVVAVKMFDALKLNQADEKILNELRSEAQMMERLSNHPNIVKFVGAITKGSHPPPRLQIVIKITGCLTSVAIAMSVGEDGSNFALVTEFCPRGSLYDLLVRISSCSSLSLQPIRPFTHPFRSRKRESSRW